MTKKRRGFCLTLALCLLIVMVSFISGCSNDPERERVAPGETWALIKIGGGEPLHVKVENWHRTSSGNVYIYTEDRMYWTSPVNVLIIEDLK